MGHFSNSSESLTYQDRYCSACVHNPDPEDDRYCAVWLAHIEHAYEAMGGQNQRAIAILDTLIPVNDDGITNEQCSLFHDGKPAYPGRVPDDVGPIFNQAAQEQSDG